MSDEAHFLLRGHVNKQNSRFWGTQNPQLIHETSLHPLKTTVWCGIHAGNIIGPYFSENDQGVAVTFTPERYQDMIRNFLVVEMAEQELGDICPKSQMLEDVLKNALKRAESCIANRGHHLADKIIQS
ncbi:hypothetical protein GWI33_020625 [Rhynchophorus ferrugineus]|uniref:Uncharacterized protein n=1 Tax=Rhynchophorus ferrugineus TaxID=354439 RepID=A0A834HR22_RHYFE|nr:hypothetical protein GWI33_020625 [Rhynchophorus ferrugineus]